MEKSPEKSTSLKFDTRYHPIKAAENTVKSDEWSQSAESIKLTGKELHDAFNSFNVLLKGDTEDLARIHSRLAEDQQTYAETGEYPAGYETRLASLEVVSKEYTNHLAELASITEKRQLFLVSEQVGGELQQVLKNAYTEAMRLAELVGNQPEETAVEARQKLLGQTAELHEQLQILLGAELSDVKRRSKLIDKAGNRLATLEDIKETAYNGEIKEDELKLRIIEATLPDLQAEADIDLSGLGPSRLPTDQEVLAWHQFKHDDTNRAPSTKNIDALSEAMEIRHGLQVTIDVSRQKIAEVQTDRQIKQFLEGLYPEKKLADAKLLQAKLKGDPELIYQASQELKKTYTTIETQLQANVAEMQDMAEEEIAENEELRTLNSQKESLTGDKNKLKEKIEVISKINRLQQEIRANNPVHKNLERTKRMVQLLDQDRDDLTLQEISLAFDPNIEIKSEVTGPGEVELGKAQLSTSPEHDEGLRQIMETDPNAAASAALPWARRSDRPDGIRVADVSEKGRVDPDILAALTRNFERGDQPSDETIPPSSASSRTPARRDNPSAPPTDRALN